VRNGARGCTNCSPNKDSAASCA
jgi:DNA-binding CsgD family transcriptional regulator